MLKLSRAAMRYGATLAVVLMVAVTVSAQRSAPPTTPALPPLSYICPMPNDADVIDDKPGKCRKCGMRLTPVRLDTVWTCPLHAAVQRDAPGRCPIDGRDLIPVTMSVSWACKNTEVKSLTPGTCPDGSAMAKQYAPRPHGNHNPQHGGQFFMASDSWHHLEGTYPKTGVFRMYFYDDYTKPLPRASMREVTGEIVVQGRTFALVPATNGKYLEARIPPTTFPEGIEAKVRFKKDAPQNTFDFTFPAYSADLTPARIAIVTTANTSPPSAASPRRTSTEPDVASAASRLSSQNNSAVTDLLSGLRARTELIRDLIEKGSFGAVYIPAFQAKDLAIELEAHESELPSDRQLASQAALTTLVRDAYLLDAFGDLGNKQQISDAFADLSAATTDVIATFSQK